jgi:crotonobetainyl-CoA:carnitine CoA-transferase CaiB-like acyl-CoA transferase
LQIPLAPGEAGAPLRQALADIFMTKTRDEWEALLKTHDTCTTPVLRVEEALQNEQVQARELVQMVNGKPAIAFPVRFSRPLAPAHEAPVLGEHNREILGMS